MEHIKHNNEERHLYNSYQWAWDMIGAVGDYGKLAGYLAGRIRKHERINSTSQVLTLVKRCWKAQG